MKNSMKTPDQKKRSKQLGKEIRDSKKRYEDLRVHGGSDPFWSDGVNMNLCRNHVMYFRKQVETELDPENYPEEYFLEIPAEVSVHYMADPDGIRSRSTAALEVLKENQDFQYLRSKLSGDLDKETSQCMNPVRYVLGMEDAIRRDDLVVMRRCQDPEYYVKYLRENPGIANFGTKAPGRTVDNMGFYRRTIVCTQKMSITEEKSFLSMRAKAPEANRGGARPGIIVSNDVGNKHAPIVEVVYLTSREKKLMPTHVRIKSSPIPSIALCEQIETVYKKRIGKYLAKATMDEMKQIDKALAVSIGLGGNMKMSDYVREWAEAFKEPDPIEEKATQILETAKPVPIQIPEGFSDKERIKELEKDLIRAEAERDVFQKLYKEQLAIS